MTGKQNIAITTLDPRFTAGVRSVTEDAYNSAEDAGFNVNIVYNAVPWDECLTIKNILKGNLCIPVYTEKTNQLDGVAIGRVLPELGIFNYLFNYNYWKRHISHRDAILAVGGPCLTGLPAALAGEDFAVWFGTTIEDEQNVQKTGYSLPKRLRYEVIRPILRRYERYVLERANYVFAQSEYTRSRAIDEHNLSPDDIGVLPCAVDTNQFCPDYSLTNPLEIVFVGRLNDPRKNLSFLLKSFNRVVTEVPEAELTLVGGQPDPEYQTLIRELDLSSNINTPGKVDSVIPYLQRATAFAYPSRQEGFGIAALEALSCGTPVVSTDCGGPTDFVIDGKTGFIVDPAATNEFADRLITLLQNQTQSREYGENGRLLVQNNFSKEHVENRLQSVLRDLSSK